MSLFKAADHSRLPEPSSPTAAASRGMSWHISWAGTPCTASGSRTPAARKGTRETHTCDTRDGRGDNRVVQRHAKDRKTQGDGDEDDFDAARILRFILSFLFVAVALFFTGRGSRARSVGLILLVLLFAAGLVLVGRGGRSRTAHVFVHGLFVRRLILIPRFPREHVWDFHGCGSGLKVVN